MSGPSSCLFDEPLSDRGFEAAAAAAEAAAAACCFCKGSLNGVIFFLLPLGLFGSPPPISQPCCSEAGIACEVGGNWRDIG